jgi:DNA-directed RNA polymerase sigma subunit (sigma70/sigma32)
LQACAGQPASLDAAYSPPISDAAAADGIGSALRRLAVRGAVARLPSREQFIIERRFDLVREPATLAAIGRELGLTHERVRQIQEEALQRLRGMLVDID